jgi:uncharacterized coiled-coil protein SlyX
LNASQITALESQLSEQTRVYEENSKAWSEKLQTSELQRQGLVKAINDWF